MPSGRRLAFIKARGNPISAYQWRRRSQAEYDDVLTGYQRNEDLGWYREATDSMAQRNAVRMLEREGIEHYDWQYHGQQIPFRFEKANETQHKIADYDWAYHDE